MTNNEIIQELERLEWEKLQFETAYKNDVEKYDSVLELARNFDNQNGDEYFNHIMFKGGEITLNDDINGTWKEKALDYSFSLFNSRDLPYSRVRSICTMIFDICINRIETVNF